MACDRRRRVSDEAIADYLHRRAIRFSQKLKKQSRCEKFVWDKKILRDVLESEGDLDLYFSVESEMEKQRQRKSELDRLRKRRDEKKRISLLSHRQIKIPDEEEKQEEEEEEEEEEIQPPKSDFDLQSKSVTPPPHEEDESYEDLKQPRCNFHVQSGYEWNKYNRTHYDHESPPPKFVQGYKFDVHYPDLVDKSRVPTYEVMKDGDSTDTCILRFHGGPPYRDLAFRIVNGGDWDYSAKNGFRCTFQGGILRLHFNFRRNRYRR